MNADPEFQKTRVAGIRRKFKEPEYRAKMQRLGSRLGQKSALDEELQERRREHGKWAYANFLSRPETVAKCLAKVKANGPKLRAIRMAWCPREMWDRHKFLVRSKKMRFEDAKEQVFREWDELRAARHPYFGSVVDFMRRRTAVIDRGAHEEKRYRVGLTDMTAGELLKRAEFNGYQMEMAA